MAYSRIRFEIQNSATMTLVQDYDRLLVAYGPCAKETPKSSVAPLLEDLQSKGFQDRNILKNDI